MTTMSTNTRHLVSHTRKAWALAAVAAVAAWASPSALARTASPSARVAAAPICGTFTTQAIAGTHPARPGYVVWGTHETWLGVRYPYIQLMGTLSNADCTGSTNLRFWFNDGTGLRVINVTEGKRYVYPYKPHMAVPITVNYTDFRGGPAVGNARAYITNVRVQVCSAIPGAAAEQCSTRLVPGEQRPSALQSLLGTAPTSGVWGPYTPRNPPFVVSTSAPVAPSAPRPKLTYPHPATLPNAGPASCKDPYAPSGSSEALQVTALANYTSPTQVTWQKIAIDPVPGTNTPTNSTAQVQLISPNGTELQHGHGTIAGHLYTPNWTSPVGSYLRIQAYYPGEHNGQPISCNLKSITANPL